MSSDEAWGAVSIPNDPKGVQWGCGQGSAHYQAHYRGETDH